MKQRKKFVNPLLLLLAAMIWGLAFVAQKESTSMVGSFTFSGIRMLLGSGALAALLPLLDKLRSRGGHFEKGEPKQIWLGGICCGLVLFVAANLQQFGIALQDPTTNVGKAGFITACYCALVPVLGLFVKKRSPKLVWIGAVVAVIGFFLLCLMDSLLAGEGLDLGLPDLLLLGCAIFFAVHILVIDHFVAAADGVRLSCIQFLVVGVLSCICMLLFEEPHWEDILDCAVPILYAAIFAAAGGYTLQIVGQKGVNPSVASLILSLESVFSVLAGAALQPETTLTRWEINGCAVVFCAVVLVNLAPSLETPPASLPAEPKES